MPYAHEDGVKVGTVLYPDGDFDCMKKGTRKVVKEDEHGNLYISCKEKRHLLDGQIDKDGYYIGLYLTKSEAM